LGGDEFVALAAIEKDEGAESLTDRLQEQFDASNACARVPYNLSVSVGVAHFENDRYSIEDLMAQADQRDVRRETPQAFALRLSPTTYFGRASKRWLRVDALNRVRRLCGPSRPRKAPPISLPHHQSGEKKSFGAKRSRFRRIRL
jgi:hypothetical protein